MATTPMAGTVLVLGGTCFQGRSVVQRLLDDMPRVDVVVANRGRTYWGEPDPWQSPRVTFLRGDRDKNGFEKVLADGMQGRAVLAVVDFACFHPRHIYPLLPLLEGWRAVYLMISTDSVYDVCEVPPPGPPGGVVETCSDVARPSDPLLRNTLHRRHRYGGNKLRIEDILHATPTLPWAALRLADVIGPMDDTGRFWATYLYARYIRDRLHLSKRVADTRVSVTYSEDVGSVILQLIAKFALQKGAPSREPSPAASAGLPQAPAWESDSSSSDSSDSSESTPSIATEEALRLHPLPPRLRQGAPQPIPGESGASIWRASYNICCTEAPTLEEFLHLVAGIVEKDAPRNVIVGRAHDGYGTADYYPSVDCGPVSNALAQRALAFAPTPLADVLVKTCAFFAKMTARMAAPQPGLPLDEWNRAMRKLPNKAKARVLGSNPAFAADSTDSVDDDGGSSSSSSSSSAPPTDSD